jgi:hypothetical protein
MDECKNILSPKWQMLGALYQQFQIQKKQEKYGKVWAL